MSSVRKRKGFEMVEGPLPRLPLPRRVAHPLGWDVGRGLGKDWIPAFAGMTIVKVAGMTLREGCRNDEREDDS